MQKGAAFYEGKAKILYATDNPDYIIQFFKDDATAFNAQKRGTIQSKGVMNNQISETMFKYLEKEGIPTHYHPDFVDHVNALEYHGTDGARRSVALYQELFPDLRFVVEEQVTEGDRVASRWTLYGTHRGRPVRLTGIVISRFEDGQIVEDWAASDTMELVRQLGIWRSLLLLAKHHRLFRDRARAGV